MTEPTPNQPGAEHPAPAHGYAPPPGYAPPTQPPAPSAYGQPPAPPAYGQPPVPPAYGPPAGQQPYGQPGAYPTPGQQYAVKPVTGSLPWGLGFLAYLPIPILNYVVTGIAMAAVYRSQSRNGAVAEGNARNAANWGLTTIVVTVVCFLVALIAGVALGNDGAWLAVLAVCAWFAMCVTHLVLIIMGLVRAGRGQVLNVPFAIPFIRR